MVPQNATITFRTRMDFPRPSPTRLAAFRFVCASVCVWLTSGPVLAVPPSFADQVQPILAQFCSSCHGANKQEGDVRLDKLDPDLVGGNDAERWHQALNLINRGEMPPADAPQPDAATLELLVNAIQQELNRAIEARQTSHRKVLRRLTRGQYTRSLQELLLLPIDFGNALPDDAKSRTGFTNNGSVLQTTSLHLEYYQKIAREALNQAIFVAKPPVTRYRITLGTDLGKNLAKEKVAGRFTGYVSQPVEPRHLVAEVLDQQGHAREIDASQRQGRYANVLRNLGIGMRGSHKERYQMAPQGMLLDSAVPHQEVAPGSWHGPSPNLKLLIRRDFPARGDFALRVSAARVASRTRQLPNTYRAGKPLAVLKETPSGQTPSDALVQHAEASQSRTRAELIEGLLHPKPTDKDAKSSAQFTFTVPEDDLYQWDIVCRPVQSDGSANFTVAVANPSLTVNTDKLNVADGGPDARSIASPGIVALPAGQRSCTLTWTGPWAIESLHLTRLPTDHAIRKRNARQKERDQEERRDQDQREPVLQVALGNRTDDGMDSEPFGQACRLSAPLDHFATYQFLGRLENLPVPQVDLNEQSSLANILVLAVWNGDFVKQRERTGTRIQVRQVEFEAPYFPTWPPASHQKIFFDSPHRERPAVYAEEVLTRFMAEAFRRPLYVDEVTPYLNFWKAIQSDYEHFEESIREVLVAVLCSPKFLYLAEAAENDKTPIQEELELASRLSYFLWNGPPDQRLKHLAQQQNLRRGLSEELPRLLADPRSWHFIEAFCDQWLRIDRHQAMRVNVRKHPSFTRFVKADLARETYHFVRHALCENLNLFTLIDSDFVIVNQNLAEFYGLPDVRGTQFRVVPIQPATPRGGLLTQGSFLSGHSDGNQGHPVKRAVWLMERILGQSPPPPPPNVPALPVENANKRQQSIAAQLAAHRDNISCRNCHKKLDPYGLVFEDYNGAGLLHRKPGSNPDTQVTLPGGHTVNGVGEMVQHILTEERHAFRSSLIEHLMTYALGRDLSFADDPTIEKIARRVARRDDRLAAVIEEIVTSPLFLQQQ
ncbi:MAG: DUF1592 domain-containing protein [Planctomycetota bacterium]|nr:DUF1592 domain-containing protein [Planctomycetota bacterium]